MSVQITPFGSTQDGRAVEKVTLRQGKIEAEVMTLGAAVLSLRVPDRSGQMVDVVLGYETPADYERNGGYLGMLVGRYANRISGAAFSIDGKVYHLGANEGTKQLHGGPEGFSFQIFSVEVVGENAVAFRYTAPDGENGYPGNLSLTATYTLTEKGLTLHYEAVCDQPTVCNITNHSYFNLNGGGTAMDHLLWIDADSFTPVDAESIPTALASPVEGTPFDFRQEKPLGRDIDEPCEQLELVGGYDHNFVLRREEGLRLAARLTGDRSGIVMETWTDKPGMQLYTANGLTAAKGAKGGATYGRRMGVCLETNFPADSPNHPEWGDIILRPGERYDYTTEYRFYS